MPTHIAGTLVPAFRDGQARLPQTERQCIEELRNTGAAKCVLSSIKPGTQGAAKFLFVGWTVLKVGDKDTKSKTRDEILVGVGGTPEQDMLLLGA